MVDPLNEAETSSASRFLAEGSTPRWQLGAAIAATGFQGRLIGPRRPHTKVSPMKLLKYLFWTALSLVLILLVNSNLRHPRAQLSQLDPEFDELAVC